jgi:methyl-accepting chemotaxis protein
MRTNLPVTNNEIQLSDTTLIVSKTDLKGRITYVNQDFLHISGFTEAELIGEPHNIVRHPDMPVEAFEDLWRTLKEGRPWTGYVKNRCKNGDYYWVLANATPIWENGQVTGYLSVRRKVASAVIPQMEEAYRAFREKKQGNLQIRYGQAVKPHSGKLKNASVSTQIVSALAVLAVVVVALFAYTLRSWGDTEDEVGAMFEHHVLPAEDLGEMSRLMAENRAQLLLALQHAPNSPFVKMHDHPQTAHTDRIERNNARIAEVWAAVEKTFHEEEQGKLGTKLSDARTKLVTDGIRPAVEALVAGDHFKANQIILTKVNPAYEEAITRLNAFQKYMDDNAKTDYQAGSQHYAATMRSTIIAILIIFTLVSAGFFLLVRNLRRTMETIVDTTTRIAQGDYSSIIDISANNEAGRALQSLQAMQTRMGFEVSETKRTADEMTRIKIALDNVSTGVMIANNERTIIYANNAVKRVLKGAEAAIRKQLPNFDADNMVGVNIDSFHKNPKHQADLLAKFTSTYVANLEISDRFMRVSASPVINDKGERLGAVAEWLDRTNEVRVEKEVADMVDGALRGNFTTRLTLEGKEGFFKQLSEGLNQLSEVTQTGLTDVAQILQRVASGDLTQKIDAEYEGIFGQLKDDTNTTIERLRKVVGRIKDATEAINIASQEIAAGNADLSSRTEEQASSLEETSSAMEELNATVRQNADNARQANDLAKTSNAGVVKGGEVVKQVVVTMGEIQASSKKISDIIGVIDSIAFQTNILALNAAVEAARAGEQGRGFAVVASEVRNLAQRSATAAKEIKTLIAESVDKVESGAKLVQEAGTTMDEVVASFQQVAGLVTEIASASKEQSSGIEQTTQAVGQMDEVTQQNAALVEEAAAAAESLEEQARGLVQTVSMFKLAEGASSRSTLPAPVLRDATPRQLPPTAANARSAPRAAPSVGRKAPPPHLADSTEQWEEF